MNALAARRRHPLAVVVLLLLGLALTGAVYSVLAPSRASASATSTTPTAAQIAEGRQLFLANCATCHGLDAQGAPEIDGKVAGPSLIGVGAAAVDFQVGTGRMPLQETGPQADPKKKQRMPQQKIEAMSAYLASLAPGPSIPLGDILDPSKGDASKGEEIFRTNCAMCHNFAAKGGALTLGKYAPSLTGVSPKHIYEAMLTGPQSMPVFNEANIGPDDKRDVIAFLTTIQEEPSPGGLSLGAIGPVSEGLVGWAVGLGLMIGCAVWLGMRSS